MNKLLQAFDLIVDHLQALLIALAIMISYAACMYLINHPDTRAALIKAAHHFIHVEKDSHAKQNKTTR